MEYTLKATARVNASNGYFYVYGDSVCSFTTAHDLDKNTLDAFELLNVMACTPQELKDNWTG